MSNNTLEFYVLNLTSCNPNNHYVKVTSFGDVWFAIYILGIVTTAIAGISFLNLIWRICRKSFGFRQGLTDRGAEVLRSSRPVNL